MLGKICHIQNKSEQHTNVSPDTNNKRRMSLFESYFIHITICLPTKKPACVMWNKFKVDLMIDVCHSDVKDMNRVWHVCQCFHLPKLFQVLFDNKIQIMCIFHCYIIERNIAVKIDICNIENMTWYPISHEEEFKRMECRVNQHLTTKSCQTKHVQTYIVDLRQTKTWTFIDGIIDLKRKLWTRIHQRRWHFSQRRNLRQVYWIKKTRLSHEFVFTNSHIRICRIWVWCFV